MTNQIYTAITFAPVQGFIEKSRKLRDLYGSSYLLSFLAWAICFVAERNGCSVVSPALPNVTQGMPNQIIIQGDFKKADAEFALNTAWECVTETCRNWIEEQVKYRVDGTKWNYQSWKRIWGLWTKYTWEFFWVQGKSGESISDVRQYLNEKKRSRAWTGINWQGESSTLSGADAIAYPGLGIHEPQKYNYQAEKAVVEEFYTQFSQKLGESFIDEMGFQLSEASKLERSKEYGESFIVANEELSVPELVKRLITHSAIAQKLIERFQQLFSIDQTQIEELSKQIQELSEDLKPDESKNITGQIQELSEDLKTKSFKYISRHNEDKQINDSYQLVRKKLPHQGWFQGDGDKAGDYLKSFAHKPEEASQTNKFSELMRNWGKDFKDNHPPKDCRVIYAGGDDFLGVFYDKKQTGELKPKRCIDFFSTFKTQVWDKNNSQPEKKPITVSVGFVWAAPGIPQRDVLQHCREAEKSAKSKGRDRIAFRVLFNNGNYLEWVCPWDILESGLLTSYRDREGKQNWTHIYNDVAVLESRHVFDKQNIEIVLDKNTKIPLSKNTEIALGLLEIYFPMQVSLDGKVQETQVSKTTEARSYWRHLVEQQDNWWNIYDAKEKLIKTGILGERKNYCLDDTEEIDSTKVNTALNDWIINLAKVGFHLCQQ
ncbi:MAG: Cas10/Cmr2 second palm domain-containing protein [Nostoc sp. CmiSLP01]|nr:type III-B CRISPR-associated protein Cas10/Cmr2 [Nostoc sp. CmiSLP01]MDZ8289073.1 type III-B CRISPR-associated protein Cas10/Cmr2 [Nostoc sp. ChiSLP01]